MSKLNDKIIVSVAGLNKVDEYRKNVEAAMEKTIKDANYKPLIQISPEPSNPYDPKALAVYIDENLIGYIGRQYQAIIHLHHPQTFLQPTPVTINDWGYFGEQRNLFVNLTIQRDPVD